MKSITILVLAVCAVLLSNLPSAAATTSKRVAAALPVRGQRTHPDESHRAAQGSDEYEPWPNGTPVAWNFPDEGWWTGVVTNYNADSGMYTVKWEDGSVDYFDDVDQLDQMVTYANQGLAGAGSDAASGSAGGTGSGSGTAAPVTATYPVGTPVSVFEEGRWWDGVIIAYKNGYYTVQWAADNEMEQVKAGAVIDQMVDDGKDDDEVAATEEADEAAGDVGATAGGVSPTAAPTGSAAAGEQLWATGTPVATFEENQWWKGHISGYANNVYTVTWDSGEVETFTDFDEVNQMVSDAETLGTSSGANQPSPPPTDAPLDDDEVDDDTAVEATIAPTDEETMAPTDKADAALPYPKGTPVYMEFEDEGWWVGELVHYSKGYYTIRWSDGSHDVFAEGERVDEIVANAAYIPDDDSLIATGGDLAQQQQAEQEQEQEQQQSSDDGDDESGMSAAGKAFLSIFVLAAVAVVAVLGAKAHRKRKAARLEATQSALEEPRDDVVAYRDEPEDDVPKII
jgi:hypothetical protein